MTIDQNVAPGGQVVAYVVEREEEPPPLREGDLEGRTVRRGRRGPALDRPRDQGTIRLVPASSTAARSADAPSRFDQVRIDDESGIAQGKERSIVLPERP